MIGKKLGQSLLKIPSFLMRNFIFYHVFQPTKLIFLGNFKIHQLDFYKENKFLKRALIWWGPQLIPSCTNLINHHTTSTYRPNVSWQKSIHKKDSQSLKSTCEKQHFYHYFSVLFVFRQIKSLFFVFCFMFCLPEKTKHLFSNFLKLEKKN